MTNGTRALVVAALIVSQQSARAEDAQTLFREGKELLDAGEVEAACEKLEASVRIEAHNATELSLADCWERLGKTASAWDLFVKLAGSAKREDRALEARKRAKALEPKLVRLMIEVGSDAELDGLVITRNDQVVDRAQWNEDVPVDPGEYTITAKAKKHEEWSTTIKVKSKNKSITVPVLERSKKKKGDGPTPPNPNRNLAIGLMAGGVGVLGVATGFGIHSSSLNDQANEICPMVRCADARAVDLNRGARVEGWVANIGWGLGSAAVVASIVVWFVGAKKAEQSIRVTPAVSDEGAGFIVGGSF